MLALSNPFYQNPEANARHLLHQQMLGDSQRIFQQSLAELVALRSLLSQGQLCLCIPLESFHFPPILPANLLLSQAHQAQQQHIIQSQPQHSRKLHEAEVTKETKLLVSIGREHRKNISALRSDECNLKADCIEITLNLREVLPAEICVGVEERAIGIEVNRVDREGIKNLWRHYDLPASVHAEAARCILSQDGFLRVSVPWSNMEL